MATRVFDGIKFYEQIGPAVWEEKMFKEIVDDARRTPHHPKSSP